METKAQTHLLIDGCMGVYIPRNFAWKIAEIWDDIDPEDLAICKAGPCHPNYDDAWSNILFSAKFTDSEGNIWHLWQEGDLFAYTGDGEQFT